MFKELLTKVDILDIWVQVINKSNHHFLFAQMIYLRCGPILVLSCLLFVCREYFLLPLCHG